VSGSDSPLGSDRGEPCHLDVDDPSLSHATDHAPRNALGLPGAMIADLITQFFGLAAIALLLPPVVWAWRLVFGRAASFGWRTFATWIAATLLAALALATLPVWDVALPTGFGGVSAILLRIPVFHGRSPGTAAAVICGVAALPPVLPGGPVASADAAHRTPAAPVANMDELRRAARPECGDRGPVLSSGDDDDDDSDLEAGHDEGRRPRPPLI
jgi:S-DNA-T family DNA segregation ATPase FtsK/SpoIIIE